ncbi:MAG: RsiV family protein [Muribaculaceae bacterium]|nr:RsiV family protein [Muribaculaceae bacterium]
MKSSTYSISLLLILAGSIAGCTSKSLYSDHTISFATISESKTYSLIGSAESFGCEDNLLFVDSVSLLIPTFAGKSDIRPLQDSIFKAAFDSTDVDHRSLIDGYFNKVNMELGFAIETEDTLINYIQADGFEVIRGSIINLTPRLMVYCITNENMMPLAAHGMQTKRYINYDIDRAMVINLTDLFTDGGIAALPRLIAERAADRVSLFGPTEVNGLPSNSNFFISPAGEIVFAYQPYEIASYAQGFINVAFFPYELINYMTQEAIIFFGLTDIAV